MEQSRAKIEDLRLEGERRLKYKGTARISLTVLHFRWDQPRESNKRQADFLLDCFQKEGCRRLPFRNHVPAIIDQQTLDVAMRRLGKTADDLLTNDEADGAPDFPLLEFPAGFQLECLHGRHRIEAGREFLDPGDDWWTVDLYLSDLNVDLKTCLIEEYSNEEKPSDGEIYYRMRHYHFQRNLGFEMRWKARLRGKRQQYLLTLTRHDTLRAAFDDLLDIPGLWGGMKITTLHKMMALKCDTELLHYLRRIKQVWSDLVRGDKTAMGKIDQATVKALELRAPRASTADATFLRSRVLGGEVFSAFDDRERDEIWNRLEGVDGLIPSLATFFKDIGYLELLADCVKRLTGDNVKISHALKQHFSGAEQEEGQVKVQVAENTFVYGQGTREDQVDLGYRQIFAYAMRHYPDMPKEPVKKDRVMKPAPKADPAVLRRFADLADQLGFSNSRIKQLQQYPAMSAAQTPPLENPPLVASGSGVKIAQRCGTPLTPKFEDDRNFWFINHLHDERQQQGKGITRFFVRKHVYLAFFGRPMRMPALGVASASHSPPAQGLGGSPRGPDIFDLHQSPRPRSSHSPETPAEEDLDLFLSNYTQEVNSNQRRAHHVNKDASLSQSPVDSEETIPSMRQAHEQEALDQERLEQERLEQERHEQERAELEKIERSLERDDLQERFAQGLQEQDILEQGKQRQQEHDKQEQERQEEENRRQVTREQWRRKQEKTLRDSERTRKRHTQIDMESMVAGATGDQLSAAGAQVDNHHTWQESTLQSGQELATTDSSSVDNREQEQQAREKLDQNDHGKIQINFAIRQRRVWRVLPPLAVSPGNTSELEHVIKEYIMKGILAFTTNLRTLAPQECFEAVTNDRTNTILLVAQDELVIDDEMLESTAKIHGDAMKRVLGLKRVATDDIARKYHARKMLS